MAERRAAVTDMLIRGIPNEVAAAIDAQAKRLADQAASRRFNLPAAGR